MTYQMMIGVVLEEELEDHLGVAGHVCLLGGIRKKNGISMKGDSRK